MNALWQVLKNDTGFMGTQVILGIGIFIFCAGSVFVVFEDDIKKEEPNFWTPIADAFKPPEPEKAKKVFINYPPVPPTGQPLLPKEPSRTENNGQPVKSSIAGRWHGRYSVQHPSMFAGKNGGWQATLSQNSQGNISGDFTSDFGISGKVSGSHNDEGTKWNVGGGGSGLSFTGFIKGHTIDGTFSGTIFDGQEASGKFFGGRIVE